MKKYIILILMCISTVVLAKKIESITFKQSGKEQFKKSALLYIIQAREGDEFNPKNINKDVKRLYLAGELENIIPEFNTNEKGNIDLIFTLIAKKKINKIYIKGCTDNDVEEVKIREKISIESGGVLDEKELQESLNAIRKLYKDEGYFKTTVTVEKTAFENDEFDITIKINEEIREEVNSVSFEGNKQISSSKLSNLIETDWSMFSYFFNTGLVEDATIQRDVLKIKNYYLNNGFLDVEVKSEQTPDDGDLTEIDVKFIIEEGKPYKIGNLTMKGFTIFEQEELMKLLLVKKGDTYSKSEVADSALAIKKKYAPKGYADFRCIPVNEADYETHIVDIEFNIVEGTVYYMRDISVSGNKITQDRVIRRELPIYPGDLLNPHLLNVSEQRIKGLTYFDKVETILKNTSYPDKKDVLIKVNEVKTGEFRIGGGFSDQEGLVGTISLAQQNFDLFSPESNFQGGGQKLKLQASMGDDSSNYALYFTEPWLFDEPLRFDMALYHNVNSSSDWDETRTGGDWALSEKIFNDFTRIKYGYRFEQITISNMDDELSQSFQDLEGIKYRSAVRTVLTKDTRNNWSRPTNGYMWQLFAELNHELLGASDSFYNLEAKVRQHYSFFDEFLVLSMGAKAGVKSMLNSDAMPLSERYFLGGHSLRGFPSREVSPVDEFGDEIGGETRALANIEVEHNIFGPFKGVIFTDAGMIGEDSYKLDGVNVGVGYGLRIDVPGINQPIRLDYALPVVIAPEYSDRIEKKWRFTFDMGMMW